MAQLGQVERVTTDPATDFRGAIAQNAAAYLDLRLPESVAAGRTCRCRLKAINIVSEENVGWEIWLFDRRRTGTEAIGDIRFLGYWTFLAASAVRIAAAGRYYQYIDGLDVPYEATDVVADGTPDDDGQRRNLHFALIARESAKSAGDVGAVRIQFTVEPTLGW